LWSAEQHKEAWIGRAENMFAQCQAHPGVLAFMMDQWAELLEQQGQAAAAAGAAGQPAGQQQQQQEGAATPKPMLEWLSEKVQVSSVHRAHWHTSILDWLALLVKRSSSSSSSSSSSLTSTSSLVHVCVTAGAEDVRLKHVHVVGMHASCG
jgi:hypothetical protein